MWRRAFEIPVLFALFAGAVSCATQHYEYLPSNAAAQTENGHPGIAYYAVPPGHPTGQVRVMSAGIVRLKPNAGGPKIPALHLRMVISNQDSPQPWIVAPDEQTISFPNDGANLAPTFFHSSSPDTPELSVAQGEIKSLDLYFAVPDKEKSAADVQEFDFRWRIQAGNEPFRETTSFERHRIAYSYAYGPYPYYTGPDGWWGPDWWWGPGPVIIAPVPQLPPSKPVIVH